MTQSYTLCPDSSTRASRVAPSAVLPRTVNHAALWAACVIIGLVLGMQPALVHAQTEPAGMAAYPAGKVFKDCPDCPELVVIPAGSYTMGSPPGEAANTDDERPQHQVTLAKSFALGKTHVTRGQFAAFVTATGYQAGGSCITFESGKIEDRQGRSWRNPGFQQTDEHPAICLNWNDAKAYVAWLSRKSGKTYSLPSEAAWEYGARAGTTTARYWGDSPDQACAYANVSDTTRKAQVPGWTFEVHNCSDGYAYTSPVASFKPNAFGLYDMIGNAQEWVEDCAHENYDSAPIDGSAWTDGECTSHVQRGGWSGGPPKGARSANRNWDVPAVRSGSLGFRVARMLP